MLVLKKALFFSIFIVSLANGCGEREERSFLKINNGQSSFLQKILYKLPVEIEPRIGVDFFDIMHIGQVNKEWNSALKLSLKQVALNLHETLYFNKPLVYKDPFKLIARIQKLDESITFENDFLCSDQFKKYEYTVTKNNSAYLCEAPFLLVTLFLNNLNFEKIVTIKQLRKTIYFFNRNNTLSSDIIAKQFGLKNYHNFYERYFSVALCLWAFYSESWAEPKPIYGPTYHNGAEYYIRYHTNQNCISHIFDALDPFFIIKITANLLSNDQRFVNHFKKSLGVGNEIECTQNEDSLKQIYKRLDNENRNKGQSVESFAKMSIERFARFLYPYAYYPDSCHFHDFDICDSPTIFDGQFPQIQDVFNMLQKPTYMDDYSNDIYMALEMSTRIIQSYIRTNKAVEKFLELKRIKSIVTIQAMVRQWYAHQLENCLN